MTRNEEIYADYLEEIQAPYDVTPMQADRFARQHGTTLDALLEDGLTPKQAHADTYRTADILAVLGY